MKTCAIRIAKLFLLVLFLLPAACGSSSSYSTNNSPGPYKVTLSLDGSFNTLQGGQSIRIAVVRATNGVKVAEGSGIVSGTLDPSFTFVSGNVMERGIGYGVHFWIDSNGNGACDSPTVDYQRSIEILVATNDVNFTEPYNPAITEDVCSTFN